MAVTDLTGYTWVGNNSISFSNFFALNLNFTSNNNNYTEIFLGQSIDYEFSLHYGITTVYDGGWKNSAYKTIEITGGTDVTNATLIAWLEANGTLTAPVVTAGSISIGSSPLQKCYVGNNEAQKIYLGDKLVYEKQAPSGYEVSVQYTNNTIKAILCAEDENGTNAEVIATPNIASYTFNVPQNKPYILVENSISANNAYNSLDHATWITGFREWTGYHYGCVLQITQTYADISLRQTSFG